MTEGEPVSGELTWVVADDGRQRPGLALPAPLIPLRLAVPWYGNPATGAMGPVETALPARLVRAMLDSPALPPAVAGRVREEMGRRWPGSLMPTPKPIAALKMLREPLQPHLLLFAGELPFDPISVVPPGRTRPPPSTGSYRAALARLSWRYGPVSIPSGLHRQPDRVVQHGGVLYQVIRDAEAEDQAAERARRLGLAQINHYHSLSQAHPHASDLTLMDPDPAAWIEFMLGDVPQLRAEGWLVDVADDFPLRLIEPDGGLSFEIQERSGIDWFDLDLGVMVEGERVSLIPALLEFIASSGAVWVAGSDGQPEEGGLPLLLPLPDGRLLAVSLPQLQPILAPLLELFTGAEIDEAAGLLRLSRRNAGDLALLEAAGAESGIAWAGGEAIRALGRQLREHGGIPPCPVPAGFQATLRAYQAHGLAWLQFLRRAGLGGVLADDMGLGKTVQALAHLAVEQAEGRLDRPALVVCPTSLVPNWQAEATRFAPSLRTLVLHGPDRSDRFAIIGGHDLVITTYPLLARDHAVLTVQDWHVVILDEAQTIKNPLANTSKLARTLRAHQRLCLSGTPLENHLGKLWSLFDFLLPGFLGDRKQFGWRYRGPIEKAGNIERQTLLAQRIAPFLLRRTKEQVASDLPPKTEINETVEMGDGQHAIYEGIRLAMHAKVRAAIARRGLAGSGIVILDALLKLRQACCDPRLLKLATAKAAKAKSAKLERLLEMLPQMLEEGCSVRAIGACRRRLNARERTIMVATPVATIRQCVVLAGGLATRLGAVAAETPKPVLEVGGRPFVAWLMRELIRFGVDEFVFLTGHLRDAVERSVRTAAATLPKPVSITFSCEPQRAGTGGALWHAGQHLHERFLLCNGDTLFDCNIAALLADAAADGDALQVRIVTHMVADASRYGTVNMRGDGVCGFDERPDPAEPATAGVISAGLYAVNRRVLDRLSPDCSLERDLLRPLAQAGLLRATLLTGWFIDIGIPADLAHARREMVTRLRRPALFVSRDVLLHCVSRSGEWYWREGIREEIARATALGWHVFACAAAAGSERRLDGMGTLQPKPGWAADTLRCGGGTLDDERAGMPLTAALTELTAAWDLDVENCTFIGCDAEELASARAAGFGQERSTIASPSETTAVVRRCLNMAHANHLGRQPAS